MRKDTDYFATLAKDVCNTMETGKFILIGDSGVHVVGMTQDEAKSILKKSLDRTERKPTRSRGKFN